MKGLRVVNLASGSKGNCTYVGYNGTNIIIDAGVSFAALRRALPKCDCDDRLAAALITHDHSDHIGGLNTLVRATGVPIYAPERLEYSLKLTSSGLFRPVSETAVTQIGGLGVQAFRLFHDATYTVGYTIYAGDVRISLITDLGQVSPAVIQRITDSNVLYIESNHDADMLKKGRYPAYLKQRISGKNGHLSNAQCAAALTAAFEGSFHDLRSITLAHLSEQNNTEVLARESAERALLELGLENVPLWVASQTRPTVLYTL